jgi:hypothetical protein
VSPLAKIGLAIAGVAGLGGIVWASSRRVDGEPDHGEDDEGGSDMPTTSPSKPMAVGEATDPKVAPLLAALQAEFDMAGIRRVKAFDMVVMSKAPLTDGPDPDSDKSRPVAIPPKSMWAPMVKAVKVVDDVATSELADVDLRFTGYRAVDYNKAVGGAKNSAHIRGTAVDVWLGKPLLASKDSKAIKAARERLKLAFAKRYIAGGKIGFGVYTNDIHFDVDDQSGRRTWGDASAWVAKAKKLPGVS